jgi:4-amino-4-deoxy-L-arabinose transferase-like glycosyltransferase
MFTGSFFKKQQTSILIFISVVFFIIYILFDNTPPHWDAGRHYYNATKYWEWFKAALSSKRENGHLDAAVSFFRGYLYYPPFVYWVSLPFQFLFGRTYQATLASNFAWIITLGSFTNLWLKKLTFSLTSRVIGLSFLLGSPFIIGQSREFQVDLPLLAILMITFWSMERLVQRFDIRNSLVFALVFCLGLMTKWSFALFVLPILICYLVRFGYLIWKYKQVDISDISFSVYSFILSVFGVCSLWYLPNIVRLKLDLFQNSETAGLREGDPQGFTFDSFLFYIDTIVNQYMWLPWVLFFIVILCVAVFLIIKSKINLREMFTANKLTFALLIGVFNFVFMYIYLMKQGNKDVRYAIILFPSLVLFLAVAGEFIKKLEYFKLLRIFKYLAVTLFMLNLLNLTLPLGSKSMIINSTSKLPLTVVGSSGYTNTRAKHENWAIYSALSKAEDLKNKYIERNDSCVVDGYWFLRPTVGVDFEPMPLHTNYGTVWGLSEQYGLQTGAPEKSCFVLVGRNQSLNNIDTSNYDEKYTLVSTESDWQGFNIKILKLK